MMTSPQPPTSALDLVVITGLSGAGRSTAAKCLEDLGWFVVDNLPPSLLSTMVDLGSRSQGAVSKIAVVGVNRRMVEGCTLFGPVPAAMSDTSR